MAFFTKKQAAPATDSDRTGWYEDTADNIPKAKSSLGTIYEFLLTLSGGEALLAKVLKVTNSAYTPYVTLTDAANIATDASLSNAFKVTLAGNRTLDNPTNLKGGTGFVWRVKQDATGSRTLGYGTKFKFPGGTKPVLTTAANSVDIISGIYDSDDDVIDCNFTLDSK